MVALGTSRAQQRNRAASATGAGESTGKASSHQHENGRGRKRSHDGDGPPNSPPRPGDAPESPPTAPNIDRVSSPRPSATSGARRNKAMRGRGRKLVAPRPQPVQTRNSLNGSLLHTQQPANDEEPAKAAPSCSSSSEPDQCDTPEKPGASRKPLEVEPGHSAGSQSLPSPAQPRGRSRSPAGVGKLSRQADAVDDPPGPAHVLSGTGDRASAGTSGTKRRCISPSSSRRSTMPQEVGVPHEA